LSIILLHIDAMATIENAALVTMQLNRDTAIREPHSGDEVPLSEIKGRNSKLSFSLNQLLSVYHRGGAKALNTFAAHEGLTLEDTALRVVIEVHADAHQPLPEDLREELRRRITGLGGELEADFHNLMQVVLPVAVLDEVAGWPEVRLVREPFRPHHPRRDAEKRERHEFLTSPAPLNPKHIRYREDYPIGPLSAGTHTVRLVLDYDNRNRESNGTDNEYTRTVTVQQSPRPVESEGVSLVGAAALQMQGYTGAGVKVAILDDGFKTYSSLLGRELPRSLSTRFLAEGEDESEHGTACAEIIYDMAPEAAFYLVQSRTLVEWGTAVDWCISQGIQVISFSGGWPITIGPLDGTGIANEVVDGAVQSGIVWVNAAGNGAQSQWKGAFFDPDGNGFLNFTRGDEYNALLSSGDDEIEISLVWSDPWGASGNDYDLLVFTSDNLSEPTHVSAGIQDGDDDPWESIRFTPQAGVSYGLAVKKYSGFSRVIHLKVETGNDLKYSHPETSIFIPSDNPRAISVGAVDWSTPSTIEYFSSRGPTTDGRSKPDLVAPDRVSTASFGRHPPGFGGTSASCPHVAGACALVKQAYPAWSPQEIKTHLESTALDLGPPGKDDTYGSGRLVLSTDFMAPLAPELAVEQSGESVSLSWSSSANADGYTLLYAPFPAAPYIGSVGMGTQRSVSFDLWSGAAFYVAVTAYNSAGSSALSNIASFTIP
jgi:subtilisin family serine protease